MGKDLNWFSRKKNNQLVAELMSQGVEISKACQKTREKIMEDTAQRESSLNPKQILKEIFRKQGFKFE